MPSGPLAPRSAVHTVGPDTLQRVGPSQCRAVQGTPPKISPSQMSSERGLLAEESVARLRFLRTPEVCGCDSAP